MDTQAPTYTNTHMNTNGEAIPSEQERRSEQGEPWRPQSMIEDNPIGLDRDTVEQLIPMLDELQASMWILYHQYHKHHWLVEGPQFRDLHLFLEHNYEEVHAHLDALAERMTALGGIPTSDPVNQAKIAFVTHEPEGTYRIRPSLRHDRAVERQIAQHLRRAIQTASERGDFGTKTLLEGILFKTEDRAHHLDHFLGEDGLEVGLFHEAADAED
ncbi:MAG: ferritin-like domain-containing protein [Rhodothermales bacterium]|nr:ferritin-like domain-containing protein [Rhodothermales bacterium]